MHLIWSLVLYPICTAVLIQNSAEALARTNVLGKMDVVLQKVDFHIRNTETLMQTITNQVRLSSVDELPLLVKGTFSSPHIGEMQKLVNIRGYNHLDPTANAWITILQSSEYAITLKAYARRFGITQLDLESIQAWTDKTAYEIRPGLSAALEKLPTYVGATIRNTRLDAESILALERGLKGETIPMTSFVKNFGSDYKGPKVLAAVPAGLDFFEPWSNIPSERYTARLVIYSQSARLVAPLSKFKENEVTFHSDIVGGFKVLGKGQSYSSFKDKIQVWFLEEVRKE